MNDEFNYEEPGLSLHQQDMERRERIRNMLSDAEINDYEDNDINKKGESGER